jgi:hypothetical protein
MPEKTTKNEEVKIKYYPVKISKFIFMYILTM